MKKRKLPARLLALLAVLVIVVSAFSIPSFAASTDGTIYLPPRVPGMDHYGYGVPVGTGDYEALEEGIEISYKVDYESVFVGQDLVFWIRLPDTGHEVHGARCLFSLCGVTVSPPYPRRELEAYHGTNYGDFYYCIVPYSEWSTMINGTDAPDLVSFYVNIGFPYANGFWCGVTELADFFGYFGYQDGKTASYDVGYDAGYNLGLDAGYRQGEADGLEEGYSTGYIQGEADGLEEGYKNGHTLGYEEGLLDGEGIGFTKGHTNGYAEGHADGYTEGEEEGYIAGKAYGYDLGYSECENSAEVWGTKWYDMIFAVVDAPVQVFSNLFNFTIFGIDMNGFVLSLVSLCVVFAVVRFFI